MRKGPNLSKDILITTSEVSHRVIIPLYIPNEADYYKESYQIFEYCLFSVLKTSVTPLKISVISNNSCDSVNEKLFDLHKQGYIDELIIEKEAIGKINSILKALRTAEERLITITDADVLFCNGWEEEVVAVFEAFPNAGAVCPVPVFRKHFHLTSIIWLKYLFSKKLYFRAVKNVPALTKFAASIGWPWLDEKWSDTIGTLEASNGKIAVLGCSHFVATYKREVFQNLPKTNSKYKLGGSSEFLYTDEPVLKMGGYRLATYDNFAYHMGNTLESWMVENYNALTPVTDKVINNYTNFKILKNQPIAYFLSTIFFEKLLYFKFIKIYLLKSKGLTETQIKNFTS
jgi:hypothetical protein